MCCICDWLIEINIQINQPISVIVNQPTSTSGRLPFILSRAGVAMGHQTILKCVLKMVRMGHPQSIIKLRTWRKQKRTHGIYNVVCFDQSNCSSGFVFTESVFTATIGTFAFVQTSKQAAFFDHGFSEWMVFVLVFKTYLHLY